MNFRDYLTLVEYVSSLGAVQLPASWTGSQGVSRFSLDGSSPEATQGDFGLPSVSKSGRIDVMLKNKNPIYVQLSDGTKLFFSLDEFRRIKGNPEVGRTMTVVFQRKPGDYSNLPAKIDDVQVS